MKQAADFAWIEHHCVWCINKRSGGIPDPVWETSGLLIQKLADAELRDTGGSCSIQNRHIPSKILSMGSILEAWHIVKNRVVVVLKGPGFLIRIILPHFVVSDLFTNLQIVSQPNRENATICSRFQKVRQQMVLYPTCNSTIISK